MIEKIADLYNSYSIQDKIIDEEFIQNFKDIVIREAGIYFYLKDIKLTDSLYHCGYNFDNKILFINLNNLINRYQKLFNNIYTINMAILKYLMNGIYYAISYKKSRSKTSVEQLILASCIALYKNEKSIWQKIKMVIDSNLMPIERITNIDSAVFLYYFQDYLNANFHQDVCFIDADYIAKVFFKDYKYRGNRIIAPTSVYINTYDRSLEEKINEDLNREEKVRLGLPITFEDLEEPLEIEKLSDHILIRKKD